MCKDKDTEYMQRCIELARLSLDMGEVPVGAIVVNTKTGEIISEGYNLRETKGSATAHAEVVAIEKACERVGSWRLSGHTLYVTLEPCPMCAGAIVNSRIDRIVYGACDAVAGACGSVIDLNAYPLNHSFEVKGGVCEKESRELLQGFFDQKRRTDKI